MPEKWGKIEKNVFFLFIFCPMGGINEIFCNSRVTLDDKDFLIDELFSKKRLISP